MREFVEKMVRQRLEDLPLEDFNGEQMRLPDDAIEYLTEVLQWAVDKELEQKVIKLAAQGYVTHWKICEKGQHNGYNCTCGLDAALAEKQS